MYIYDKSEGASYFSDYLGILTHSKLKLQLCPQIFLL